jgi:hypothetical protein
MTSKDQNVRKLARLRELLKQAKGEADRQTLRSAILVLQRRQALPAAKGK